MGKETRASDWRLIVGVTALVFAMAVATAAVDALGRASPASRLAAPAGVTPADMAGFPEAWRRVQAGSNDWARKYDLDKNGLLNHLDAALMVENFLLSGPPVIPALTNLFFLHHSTGEGFVVEGDMRGQIAEFNATHGTKFEFWDHQYNEQGLRDPEGTLLGRNQLRGAGGTTRPRQGCTICGRLLSPTGNTRGTSS